MKLFKLCYITACVFQNTPQLRSVLLILLTGFVVVPLAMLHSLDSLSNFSAISLTFYCIFVVEVDLISLGNYLHYNLGD